MKNTKPRSAGASHLAMTIPVLSPCVGICTIDEHGLCRGCFRNLQEIGAWLSYTPAQREHLTETVLPAREAGG